VEKRQFEIEFSLKNNNGVMYERVIAQNSNMAWHHIEAKYGDNLYRIYKDKEIREIGSQASSSNSDDSGDTGLVIFGIVGAILYGLWILLSNIIQFGLISKYDFDLYLSNITHFHSKFERKVSSIDTTIEMTYPDKFVGKNYRISKNKIVFYNGYKDSETDRKTAVSLYDNNIKIYGYITHKKDVKPLKVINKKIIKKINQTIKSRFKIELESKVKIYTARTKEKIKDFENKDYKDVSRLSNKNITYFCNRKNFELVKNIESKYYDDEMYEKKFAKLWNKYSKTTK